MKVNLNNLSNSEIAELVAERVMGWRQDKPKTKFNHPFWEDAESKTVCLVGAYDPWNIENHALVAADKLRDISILKRAGRWQVRNEVCSVDMNASGWYDNLSHAICVYLLRMSGLEVEEE